MTARRLFIVGGFIVLGIAPAGAATLFSAVTYFGNIGDQGLGISTGGTASTLDAGKCSQLNTKYRDGKTAGQIINAASAYTGVSAARIAAMIAIESSFDQDATSKGEGDHPIAYGLMQTIPGTYNNNKRSTDPAAQFTTTTYGSGKKAYDSYAVTTDPNPILNNPEAAVFAGAKYFRMLIDRYDKKIDPAVAAYNAGEGYIDGIYVKGAQFPPAGKKIYEESENHIKKFKDQLKTFEACETKTAETASTLGPGANTNAAATKLKQWVADHPVMSCQRTNGTGDAGCANTDFQVVLPGAFPSGHASPADEWIPTSSTAGNAPDTSDLAQAQQILAAGNLPVWHVRGDASGQHWIVVTAVKGTDVEFFDPATGTTDTRSFSTKSASSKYPNDYYFGISDQGGRGDNSQNKRGQVYYTNVKP